VRLYITIILIGLAFIGSILPERNISRKDRNPQDLLKVAILESKYVTVDEVARLIVQEDTAAIIIDVRSADDYKECNIPGAINMPLEDLLNPDWSGYLDQPSKMKIFYSNGNHFAHEAWMLVEQKGTDNNYVMRGGLNEWFKTVMLSEFRGGKISPRENFIFENRYKAREYFNRMNSLPDSIKSTYLTIKRAKEAELVGGCE